MGDQHAKGAVSRLKGTAKGGVGTLTGDRKLQAKGKAQKVQGKAQGRLADVQGRGRLQPILLSATGAVIVVVVAGLLTGLVRMGRGPG